MSSSDMSKTFACVCDFLRVLILSPSVFCAFVHNLIAEKKEETNDIVFGQWNVSEAFNTVNTINTKFGFLLT